MKTIKQLEKEIKKIEKKEGDLEYLNQDWVVSKVQLQTLKEILNLIDKLDIELFLEDVVDKKTGKKVELPKEIWDLWTIYWEHIKEGLEQKIQGK